MFKVWLTLVNISHVLLNLIKRLTFVMFKDSSLPNVHAVNSHIFSLVPSITVASHHIPAILTIAPLILESLLGNTSVTMAILQKCPDTFSS